MRNQHSAICVHHGKIISSAVNTFRNDPAVIFRENVQSRHAEINSLRRLVRPHGVVLYVARWSSQGHSLLSRPCDSCMKTMENLGVKTVVYTL